MQKTVLITAFEPWGNNNVNASRESINKVVHELWENNLNVKLEKVLLKVTYEAVGEIPNLYDQYKPDLCIHFGMGYPGAIELEKYARNEAYTYLDDIESLPPLNKCEESGPQLITTRLDLEKICQGFIEKNKDVLIKISENAGLYLFEYIYYKSLYTSSTRQNTPVIFVHVPPLEQPYSLDQTASACKSLIEVLINEIQNHNESSNNFLSSD